MNVTSNQRNKIDALLLDALTRAEPDDVVRVIMVLQPTTRAIGERKPEGEVDPSLFESRQDYRKALIERERGKTRREIGETIEALENLSLRVHGGEVGQTIVVEGSAQQILLALELSGVRRASLDRTLPLIRPSRSLQKFETSNTTQDVGVQDKFTEKDRSKKPSPWLSSTIYELLRDTLLNCDEFDSQERLINLFATSDLKKWLPDLPMSRTPRDRVYQTIQLLRHASHETQEENTLIMLLRELSRRHMWDDFLNRQLNRALRLLTDGTKQKPLKVFLCHDSENKPIVRNLYQKLRTDGIEVWIDEENLLLGQDWQQEIPKMIRSSEVIIVCLSGASIIKSSYVQKEISYALNIADEQPEGTIFIISLKLEEFDVPEGLRQWHWINFFEDREEGYKQLLRALWHRASELGLTITPIFAPVQTEPQGSRGLNFTDSAAKTSRNTSIYKRDVEQYEDFELHVSSNGIITARSKEGERRVAITLNIPSKMNLALQLIEHNKTNEKFLQNFGRQLYHLLFPHEIDVHLNQTDAVARFNNRKLRFRLTIEPDWLARLPWEFLYRQEQGYFIAANISTVLSRYLDLPLPQRRVHQSQDSLHMLTIIANPMDQLQLDAERWKKIITRSLEAPIEQGRLTLTTVKHATYEAISHALRERPPDILQFIGHGVYHDGKGFIALVDSDTGATWKVDDATFANIFLNGSDRLGLVSLVACDSAESDSRRSFLGVAPRLVQHGIPAVIAMQYDVLVSTAEVFLEHFYKAIVARQPVDWATQEARNAIFIKQGKNNREFATPVLYMRAKDGKIF